MTLIFCWRRILCCAGIVVLLNPVGCAMLPEHAVRQPENWRQTAAKLTALQQWRLSARLGVQTPTQGGSLDLYWQQDGDRYRIRLIAPLGQGAMLLDGDADQVSARSADGQRFQGAPSQLMLQHFGIAVPVAALRYWLRGLPAPNTPLHDVSWNADGHLQRFSQNGWTVELRDYKKLDGVVLPHRFYLEPVESASAADGGDTSVRLLVHQWVPD